MPPTRWAVTAFLYGLSQVAAAPAAAATDIHDKDVTVKPVTQIIFWVGDMPQPRVDYEQEILLAALERTPEFGDYVLELDYELRSQERLAREITKGEGLHILNGPGWSFTPEEKDAIDTRIIPIPLVNGLLGYRECIIRRADRDKFAAITTEEDLQEISMGLGQGWLDTEIMRQNGYAVVGAPDLHKLYDMLKRERFDCLPLGIGEAEGSLAEHDPENQLMIAEQMLLFYPLPVFMQVSGKTSALANRMEKGLRLLQQDGTLARIFHKHYHSQLQRMQSPEMRVFRLENPLLPAELQSIGTTLIKQREQAAAR